MFKQKPIAIYITFLISFATLLLNSLPPKTKEHYENKMEPIFNIATVLYSIEDDLSKEEFSSISNHFENLCKKTNETNDIFKKMNYISK